MSLRITLFAGLAPILMLTACATAPAGPPATGPAATPPRAGAPNAIESLLRGAGSRDAPTAQAVERAIGPPDLRRADGGGLLLTYRLPDCALLLIFSADERNTMRLAEASPGPDRLGEPRPSLEQCAASAASRSR